MEKIIFSKHAKQQMLERGALKKEILDASKYLVKHNKSQVKLENLQPA